MREGWRRAEMWCAWYYNDSTLELLAWTAVSQAQAGADVILTYFAKDAARALAQNSG
jgi:delta-aminolevulinic acid dehydratase/porphobilinogen synthase